MDVGSVSDIGAFQVLEVKFIYSHIYKVGSCLHGRMAGFIAVVPSINNYNRLFFPERSGSYWFTGQHGVTK